MRTPARQHLNTLGGTLLMGVLLSSCSHSRSTDAPAAMAVARPPELLSPASLSPTVPLDSGMVSGPEASTGRYIHAGSTAMIGTARPAPPVDTISDTEGTSLDFVSTDIGQVVKAVLGDILHLNYAVDPGVTGTLTFQTASPVAKADVLPALEQVLRLSSVAIVKHGNLYIVEPAPVAAQSAETIGSEQAGYGVAIIPLHYISADDMQRLLSPISPPGAILKADESRNLIIIAGGTQDRQAMIDNIRIFDVDWMTGMSFGLFPLQTADATAMASELTDISGGKGGPLDGLVKILPIQRLNAILLISPQRKYISQMSDWIQRLDRGQDTTQPHLYVYYVKNGRASELAQVLNRILTGTASGSAGYQTAQTTQAADSFGFSQGGVAGNTAGLPQLQNSSGTSSTSGPLSAPQDDSGSAASAASQQSSLLNSVNQGQGGGGSDTSGPSGPASSAEAGLRITADESTNSLLIYATDRQYKTISSALVKLDIAPLQVMLEAAVAEVDLTNQLKYGLQYYYSGNHGQNQVEQSSTVSNTSGLLPSSFSNTLSSFPGLGYMFASGNNIRVVLSALSDITHVNVISSPKLLVLSNQTAALQVGDQVPIVTSAQQSTSSNDANIVNSIAYQPTGVILKVTPRVNEGGLVTMDISQEVSSVANSTVQTTATNDSPTIQDRKITTTVAVQDGETVALGGLIQDNTSREHNGVPFLQEIPGIGNLFRATDNSKSRTELLVLVTPHIIQSVQRMRDVTDELRSEMSDTAPVLQN